MAGETIEIEQVLGPDHMATEIANRWREWSNLRQSKVEEWKELRNYLYATDTSTTKNAMLPWSNSTTTPKLTQIMDNLHANYFATLFPQQKWMRFEADSKDGQVKAKRDVIQAYMDNKIRQSSFTNVASDLLYDYIQYGNCFATVAWEDSYQVKESGDYVVNYVGPRVVRISPYDLCFNPTASSFEKAPKIIKSIKTLGEIKKMIEEDPSKAYMSEVFNKMMGARAAVRGSGESTFAKADGYIADGFTSIQQYYESDYVEILTFYGDFYDTVSGKLHSDRVITVVDRAYVLANEENPSWLGSAPIFHAGWRPRPDNLYAMGPLDNLVGMQYRIDHLENLKSDVFDQIAYPILKIRGDVEDFDFEPAARIYMGEEGDVGYLVPDATALQADLQIRLLEDKMEEMAGAPKQAMGIRTAGEKTAFEVQSLQNAASRIFEHKTAHFERVFLEPILNAMLEVSRRNMNVSDTIRVMDDATGAVLFKSITKDDITATGKIVPVGARHFAERARRVQNLTQLYQIKLSDPSVAAHMSGKEFARILADELGEPTLFSENIAVSEQLETQQQMQEAEAINQEQLMTAQEMGI
jgi:AraC-like DNA-binding protein